MIEALTLLIRPISKWTKPPLCAKQSVIVRTGGFDQELRPSPRIYEMDNSIDSGRIHYFRLGVSFSVDLCTPKYLKLSRPSFIVEQSIKKKIEMSSTIHISSRIYQMNSSIFVLKLVYFLDELCHFDPILN